MKKIFDVCCVLDSFNIYFSLLLMREIFKKAVLSISPQPVVQGDNMLQVKTEFRGKIILKRCP